MPGVSDPSPEPLHRALGLTDDEASRIDEILGREPNGLELAKYSVMWSEHYSYKSSGIHLKRLLTEAPWVLAVPAAEADAVVATLVAHDRPARIVGELVAGTGRVRLEGDHRDRAG